MPDGQDVHPAEAAALLDPREPLERQNEKLRRICEALMRRAEQSGDGRGDAFSQFQRAVLLEDQVRERTRDLEQALDLLNESNARLAQASRATERARSDLAGAIETVQEGFALFDESDRLVLCNSRFAMHLGDIRDDLLPGLSFASYVDLVSRSTHLDRPADLTPEAWAEARMARHGEARVVFNVRMSGERMIQVSEHRTAGGQTVIMQTDVSDIIRAEREEHGKILDVQSRMIRATLEHLSQGVCIVAPDGTIAAFNRRLAGLLAIPIARLRSGASFDVVLDHLRIPDARAAGDGACQLRAWRAQPSPHQAFRADLRSGGAQWLDVFAAETPDGGFVLSVTDVSAERASARALHEANELLEERVTSRTLDLEDALEAAERANASRTRFVAAASHDLLQPLSAAKLYLASIEDEVGPGRHQETLGKAQNALTSVQDMIEALLDISRLESGHAVADARPVDLSAILAQLRDEFAPAAALKGLSLRVRASPMRVVTDPAYLRRILQNLLANAVRYTERGRIVVGLRRQGATVRIGVWDTGPGIAEAEHESIFREFHRLGRRASASEGLGLGLAIVERACALLGHPLTLRSAPGRGSVFEVAVPLAALAPLPVPPPAPRRTRPSGDWRHEGLVAMVVEDDLDMRRALALLLENWSVEVHAVGSGDEALRCIANGVRPHALLVDYQLGDEELGTNVIADLRRRLGRIPARLVTASRTQAVRQEARRLGIEILHKPVDPLMLHLFLGSAALARPS